VGSTTTTFIPGSFNGTSQYAGSLQNMIDHEVAIASIPLQQLSQNLSSLQAESSEIGTLQSKFGAILTSIQSLTSASAGQSLAASTSDSTIATVTLDSKSAVSAGTYKVTVVDPGSPSTTLSDSSLPTVSDPTTTSISSSSNFTLTVGTSTFTINPAQNTLDGLVQAINAAGAPVSASLVNLGPPSAPNYRLSLQSTALGAVPIQLNDGSSDLLSSLTTGSAAKYQVNGQPSTPISSDTSTVTLAPGVTVNLLQAGQTTVSISPSASAASDALSSFVAAYNAASAETGVNHGTAGGALTGQSLIFELEQGLRNLTGYSGGSGAVQSLADLGISFNDSSGTLSFDANQFAGVAAAHPSDVAAFLGTGTGSGFLATATGVLNGLNDPTTGLFEAASATNQAQINTDNAQIITTQDRITAMQNSLVQQMTAADTIIAQLESQVSYFTTLFADQQNASKNGG
jgi:flagellar hook-associated protein 2